MNKNDTIEKYKELGKIMVIRKLLIINYGFKRKYLCSYTTENYFQ